MRRLVATGAAWWTLDRAAAACGLDREQALDRLAALDGGWLYVWPDNDPPLITLSHATQERLGLDLVAARGRGGKWVARERTSPTTSPLGCRDVADREREPLLLIGLSIPLWYRPPAETVECDWCDNGRVRSLGRWYCLRCDRSGRGCAESERGPDR